MEDPRNMSAVVACADLVGRCGATGFEIGYVREDVPSELAGWYAHVQYKGRRVIIEEQSGPAEVALLLAQRMLRGAQCRCGRKVILGRMGRPDRCLWELRGKRWEPGCDAPPMTMPAGAHGDYAAMKAAESVSRADRVGRYGGRFS